MACLLCPAGTYNPTTGATSIDACLGCPEYEGSDPGADVCWPGVRGAWKLGLYSTWYFEV